MTSELRSFSKSEKTGIAVSEKSAIVKQLLRMVEDPLVTWTPQTSWLLYLLLYEIKY
jgi:hypothetical protein